MRKIILLIMVGAIVAFMLRVPRAEVVNAELISISIALPIEQQLRQGINECGPYSVAAAMAAVKGAFQSPVDVVHETPWRLPSGGTLPWGMMSVIESNGFVAEPFTARGLSDDDKVRVLANELADGHPVILLGRKEEVLHYVTVLGYDRDVETFHFYDPWHPAGNDGLTVDENGAASGNRSLTRAELFDFWQGGGTGPFYRWYGIAVGSESI